MEHALFIGGFKHGALEALPETTTPKLAYQFPVLNKVTWHKFDPIEEALVPFYTIEYKHEGIWNGHYGYVHVYIESQSKYVSAIIPGILAEALMKHSPQSVFILETNPIKDEYATLVELDAAKQFLYLSGSAKMFPPSHFVIPDAEFIPPHLWTPVTYEKFEQTPEKPKVTIAGISKLLKAAYEDQIKVQMATLSWIYNAEGLRPKDEVAWLNGGQRDVKRERLCYECAKEIVGFDFAKVNDLKVPKGTGKRVRKLVCGNCGRGKFNRRGQRIGEWPRAVAGE